MLADQVLAALRAAVNAAGSQSELARETRGSQATINAYLNNRRSVGNMTLDTFERLLPRLGLVVQPAGKSCPRCASLPAAVLALAARLDALPADQRGAVIGRIEVYEEQQKPHPAAPRPRAAGA